MLSKLFGFWQTTAGLRARFGTMAGLRLGASLRQQWTAPAGTLLDMRIPGLTHPVCCRAGTSDCDVVRQIFVDDELGFDISRPPATIVDAGANIGLASIRFAQRWPDAIIHAIELDPANFELLQRNVAPYPGITPHLAALWGNDGEVAIDNPGQAAWALRARSDIAPGEQAIRAITVDTLRHETSIERINLLKIDIEGGERDVFAGRTDWLDAVDCIAIELHPGFTPDCTEVFDHAMRNRVARSTNRGEYRIVELDGSRAAVVSP